MSFLPLKGPFPSLLEKVGKETSGNVEARHFRARRRHEGGQVGIGKGLAHLKLPSLKVKPTVPVCCPPLQVQSTLFTTQVVFPQPTSDHLPAGLETLQQLLSPTLSSPQGTPTSLAFKTF